MSIIEHKIPQEQWQEDKHMKTAINLYNMSEKRISFSEYLQYFYQQCPREGYLKNKAEQEQKVAREFDYEKAKQEAKREAKERIDQLHKPQKKRKRHYSENSICKDKNKKFFNVMRQIALDRDGNKCAECGRNEYLEVHHIVERKDGGTDDLSNLTSLCPLCHAKKHKGQPVYNIMIKRARQLLSSEIQTA